MQRLHGDQRQQLQQMILDHVAKRSRGIVERGSTGRRDRFVPDDLDPLDMVGVPDRLEETIGKAQPQNILHRLFSEKMVEPEDVALGERLVQQAIQRLRRFQTLPEGLFQHHLAALGQFKRRQRFDRRANNPGGNAK
jgi:hypothetical protein